MSIRFHTALLAASALGLMLAASSSVSAQGYDDQTVYQNGRARKSSSPGRTTIIIGPIVQRARPVRRSRRRCRNR